MTRYPFAVFAAALAAAIVLAPASHAEDLDKPIPAPQLDTKAPGNSEVAVLAGGCFWGQQGVFEHVKGVTRVVAGYSGGSREDATYPKVGTERTGHAESVKITFNPKEIADNLKDYGSFIPGYRPGKRTADYLERVLMRITFVGAAFLAIIAIIPSVISSYMEIDYRVASFYGGTGLLIVISVALDLVQKINSHLVMRNYPGLTED